MFTQAFVFFRIVSFTIATALILAGAFFIPTAHAFSVNKTFNSFTTAIGCAIYDIIGSDVCTPLKDKEYPNQAAIVTLQDQDTRKRTELDDAQDETGHDPDEEALRREMEAIRGELVSIRAQKNQTNNGEKTHVIERIIAGVTEEQLELRLDQLDNKLQQQLAAAQLGSGNGSGGSDTFVTYVTQRAFAQSQKIDKLDDVTITNATFEGESPTGLDFLALSGGTLTGSLTAPTLTINGTTTFNGVGYLFPSADGTNGQVLSTNGAGGLTWESISSGFSGGELTASHVTATSTTATSTFANHISIATDKSYRINGSPVVGRGSGADSFFAGFGNTATGTDSVVFGKNNNAGGSRVLVAGYNNSYYYGLSNTGSTVLGSSNTAKGGRFLTAIGSNNTVTAGSSAGRSIALGSDNSITANSSIAIGHSHDITNSTALAIGYNNSVTGLRGIAIGADSTSDGRHGTAIGSYTTAGSDYAQALGYNNTASAHSSVASGYSNTIRDHDQSFKPSVAMGAWNVVGTFSASHVYGSAIGVDNDVFADYGSAFGYKNNASGYQSNAFGYKNTVSATGTSVFGSNINNSVASSTMIGPGYNSKITILGDATTPGFTGIGTTTPDRMLVVEGGASVCSTADASCPTSESAGDLYATSRSGGAIDVAEWIKVDNVSLNAKGEADISAGELVCASESEDGKATKCVSADQTIIGVVSTQPHLTMGAEYAGPDAIRLALAGRVPVQVTDENGSIERGDRITVSETYPGKGTKATKLTQTVGTALEAHNGGSGEIMVLVDLSWAKLSAANGDIADNDMWSYDGDMLTLNTTIDANGFNIANVKAISGMGDKWKIDETGKLQVREVCIGDTCVDEETLKDILRVVDSNSSATSNSQQTTDDEPPIITIAGNNPAYVEVGATYNDLGATMTDNEDDNLGIKASINGTDVGDQSNISIDTSTTSEYKIEYRATDNAGNTGTATRIVFVEETNTKTSSSAGAVEDKEDINNTQDTEEQSTNTDEEGDGKEKEAQGDGEQENQNNMEENENNEDQTGEEESDTDTATSTPTE